MRRISCFCITVLLTIFLVNGISTLIEINLLCIYKLSVMKKLFTLLFIVAYSFANAQGPYLLRDINKNSHNSFFGEIINNNQEIFLLVNGAIHEVNSNNSILRTNGKSFISNFIANDNHLYFNGVEDYNKDLYRCNLSTNQIELFVDLDPGEYTRGFFHSVNNNQIIYSAEVNNEVSLWHFSEETTTHTKLMELNLGMNIFGKENFTVFNGKIYFTYSNQGNYILFEIDNNNINQVKILESLQNINIIKPYTIGNYMYVSDGYELWQSDGTNSGTKKIQDNVDITFYDYLYYDENTIITYGRIDDEDNYDDILKLNPITNEITIIEKMDYSFHMRDFTKHNNYIYFLKSDNLWKLDLSTSESILVHNFGFGANPSIINYNENLVIYNNGNFFSCDHADNLLEINENIGLIGTGERLKYNKTNDNLFFVGKSIETGIELFKLNNEFEISLAKDFNINTLSSFPHNYKIFGDKLVFTIADYIDPYYAPSKYDIWITRGDGLSTEFVFNLDGYYGTKIANIGNKLIFNHEEKVISFDLIKKSIDTLLTGEMQNCIKYNENVIFSIHNSTWITDGTSDNTKKLEDLRSSNFCVFNEKVYFAAYSNENKGLWVTDGSENGTFEIYPSSEVKQIIKSNDRLYFINHEFTYGTELWHSDGTIDGTSLYIDLNEGWHSSDIGGLVNLEGNLIFFANSRTYKIDRTGTLFELNSFLKIPYIDDYPDKFQSTIVNNTLYFVGDNNVTGEEIWYYNNQMDSAALLYDLNTGDFVLGGPHALTSAENGFYFLNWNTKESIWFYDVDSNNMKIINNNGIDYEGKDDYVGYSGKEIIYFDNKLYFSGYNDRYGHEIFFYDPNAVTINRITKKESNINCYPNPVTEEMCIESFGSKFNKVRIYSIDGKLIHTFNTKEETLRFNLKLTSNLSGIYIVEILNENRLIETKKIIKL